MASMKKMKSFQKDLDKLKRRHKGDRGKLAKAQSDFYKEKGINPSAGCIPYILQIVVLIALFRLFMNVLSPDVDTVAKFNELLYEPLQISEGTTLNTNFLYLDITRPDVFKVEGIPFPLPGLLLILAAAVQFLSAKITTPYIEAEKKAAKLTKEMSDDIQVTMQSSMIYMFPLITIIAGISFPSGLALYWLMFSLSQAWIQYRSSGWGGATPWIKKLERLANSR